MSNNETTLTEIIDDVGHIFRGAPYNHIGDGGRGAALQQEEFADSFKEVKTEQDLLEKIRNGVSRYAHIITLDDKDALDLYIAQLSKNDNKIVEKLNEVLEILWDTTREKRGWNCKRLIEDASYRIKEDLKIPLCLKFVLDETIDLINPESDDPFFGYQQAIGFMVANVRDEVIKWKNPTLTETNGTYIINGNEEIGQYLRMDLAPQNKDKNDE